MNCIYCGKEIINTKRPHGDKNYSKVYRSSEHVIQNAIGGKLESEKICCDRCNFHIEELVDKEFCEIFSPIISHINNFRKTNNSNSAPKYSGYALYNNGNENIIISADVIKKSKLKQSSELIEIEKKNGTCELNKRLKEKINRSKVLFSDFKLNNVAFKKGISKIAYNYAIYLGINPKKISNACKITLDEEYKEISSIYFNTEVIPFYPGNKLDTFIELNTDVSLFHNLILYRYGRELWCYVELFNTFQYYVLLSKDFKNEEDTLYKIYGQEFQYVQSNMATNHRYNNIITEKIKKYIKSSSYDVEDFSGDFYFLQNELQNYFRIFNPLKKNIDGQYEFIHYPLWIVQAKKHEEIAKYTTRKFRQLNGYLKKDNTTISYDDLNKMSQENQNKFFELLSKCFNNKK